MYSSFQSLGLSQLLLNNIVELGYQAPTLIQQKAIPILLTGKQDMVALAQTGTGKTAAFGLPLIELCNEKIPQTQALVLAPTRELCVQITSDFEAYTQNVKRLNITAVYGGASITDQIRKIKQGCQIVVATPGRLIDLLTRNAVDLENIKYFVLDEADEMLKMGFQEDLNTILKYTNEEKSVWLFSATMPPEINQIAKNYMHQPIEIAVGNKNQTNANIQHQFVMVTSERERYEALKRVIDFNTDIYGLVFCRTKLETQEVSDRLMTDGYNADALHGDLSQAQRDKVLNNFRNRNLQILVATDVAARGIDISDISHVLNLNLPDEMEYYTHRSGRTARAGKTGVSISIITFKEESKLRQIERKLKTEFEHIAIPTGKDICHAKMVDVISKVEKVQVNTEEIAPFLPALYHSLENLSKEEIIAKFASLEFNHFLEYYRNSVDLNIAVNKRKKDQENPKYDFRYASGTRLFINIGKMDGFDKMELLAFISQKTNVQRRYINRIEVKGAYSFFEVESDFTERIFEGLHNKWLGNRQVRIEDAPTRNNDNFGGYSSNKPPKKDDFYKDKDQKPAKSYKKDDYKPRDFKDDKHKKKKHK